MPESAVFLQRGGLELRALHPAWGMGRAQSVSAPWRRVVPSEGSHATFAPRGWKQRALQDFAEQELGQHCEVEHVACGSGLERIYRFLDSDIVDHPPKIQHVRRVLSTP